jgi:3-deoxy-7-phosphoheptulonate synthase
MIEKVGRMAGQFAKPRSEAFEERDGVKLPSYRGDNINGDAFNEKSRIPDPQRMVRAAMQRVTQWNLDFTQHSEQGDR